MGRGEKPPADVAIDAAMVVTLLEQQHPDLAALPLSDAAEGWDNRVFRLGDELAVRLPRRQVAAALIENEQRWLPNLAPLLPVPIPVPCRIGRPGAAFPWAWSITAWLPGQAALLAPVPDAERLAIALGRFLHALHVPAPADAPRNEFRGVPLAARSQTLHAQLQRLGDRVGRKHILDIWRRSLDAAPRDGPPLWIHGDLHPGNVLVREDELSGVIDFGDLTAGDPATDLAAMWMLLPTGAHPTFLDAARGTHDAIEDDTLMRARGWALALAVAYLAHAGDDEPMGVLARTTLDAVLNE